MMCVFSEAGAHLLLKILCDFAEYAGIASQDMSEVSHIRKILQTVTLDQGSGDDENQNSRKGNRV